MHEMILHCDKLYYLISMSDRQQIKWRIYEFNYTTNFENCLSVWKSWTLKALRRLNKSYVR
jgi:hypothetical protein